jgi:NitT/TauT family transport system substrate-binding protein
MGAALNAHTVDAAWMAEPFITEAGEQAGAKELADTATGPLANFPVSGYATLRSYAQANPSVIAEFTAALDQAQTMSSNHSVLEQALATYINGITPALVAAVQPEQFPAELDRATLQRVADTMLSDGLLTKPFNVGQLLSP